ncbi:MAG TPA: vitamin B12-dependent ribonucleotide reductase [Candidatus Thermoplasmatota archaeon]|nr:vitamin B12-dependent ribonucleotide reductase [Candidatus Thermoplasmatota archaeon]
MGKPSLPAGERTPRITENAHKVLEKRYLAKAEDGKTILETPAELFWRVAYNLAEAERLYGADEARVQEVATGFYRLMANLEFLPNSPTLMNAGRELQQLSACFVLPVPDDIPGIFEAVKQQAIIHKTGGGTGFSFSRIRPKNDIVRSTSGVASGPISFMKIFNTATEQIKQGGTRRGANMAILRVDHPDILDFIDMKLDLREMTNFNVSVALTDKFMKAYERGEKYDLINPKTKKVCGQLDAREVMDRVAKNAHRSGEPGLFFIDRANQTNPVPHIAEIEATNPCGEQDLMPYDSCNLGSIVLDNHLVEIAPGRYEVDWDHMRASIETSVRLLDNVIDMNSYPLPEIEKMSKGTRRIGLGIMGFSRMLFKLGIAYDSPEGVDMARQVMRFIQTEGVKASEKLATERGPYGFWEGSVHQKKGLTPRRNSYVTTIAPTGTISMIADTSGGCEPEFSLIWYKNVMDGTHLPYVLDYFIEVAKREGWYYDDLMKDILSDKASDGSKKYPGSCRGLAKVPAKWQKIFGVSMDVSPEWHVRMQAAFQEYVDAAVSKTINLPKDATVEDVKTSYLLSYRLGCKGVTVYRDGSREDQVLNVGESTKGKEKQATQTVLVAPEAKEVVGAMPAGKAVLKPRARPDVVVGTTQKIETGYGSLYVTINEDDQGLFEVFAAIGRGGGYTASFTEAIARLTSLCLRSGIEAEDIIHQLEGIRSPKIAWDHREKIMSVPDAVAKALRRQVNGELHKSIQARLDSVAPKASQKAVAVAKVETDTEADKELGNEEEMVREMVRKGMNPECPECENVLSLQEGCVKCLSCGYSEC